MGKGEKQPNITYRDGEHYVTAITSGTTIGFKYFDVDGVNKIFVTVKNADGVMEVTDGRNIMGKIKLIKSKEWKTFSCDVNTSEKVSEIYFVYKGKGKMQFKDFEVK